MSVDGNRSLQKAWRDVMPMLLIASTVIDSADLQFDQLGLESAEADRKRIEAATEALDDRLIEGSPK